MKVYGPFHALNNPLVAIALGLHGATDALEIYKDYQEAHKNDFLTKALLTGQPVTELEGGPFRKLASKVTGGFIHPNIEASGSDLATELLALRNLEGTNLKEGEALANIRSKVGPGPFAAGGHFAELAKRLGMGDLTGLTPSEIYKSPEEVGARAAATATATEPAKVQAATDIARATQPLKLGLARAMVPIKIETAIGTARATEPVRVDTAIKSAEGRLGVSTSPEAIKGAADKSAAVATATEPIRVRTAKEEAEARGKISLGLAGPLAAERAKGALGVAASPLGLSVEAAKARTKAIATGEGKNVVIENTKLGDMRDYNVYNNRFENLGATTPEAKYGEIKGPKYAFKKGSKGDIAFAAVPSAIRDLDILDSMVQDPKNSDIFPIAGTPASLWAQGKANWRHKVSDPRLNRFYSYNLDLVRAIRAANGGRVMQAELGMGSQYWPNPGMGIMLARSGMLGRLEDDIGLDATPSETASEMHAKIVKAKHQIIEDAQGTARGGISESDDLEMKLDEMEGE